MANPNLLPTRTTAKGKEEHSSFKYSFLGMPFCVSKGQDGDPY